MSLQLASRVSFNAPLTFQPPHALGERLPITGGHEKNGRDKSAGLMDRDDLDPKEVRELQESLRLACEKGLEILEENTYLEQELHTARRLYADVNGELDYEQQRSRQLLDELETLKRDKRQNMEEKDEKGTESSGARGSKDNIAMDQMRARLRKQMNDAVQAESARADKVAIQYRHLKKEYDELRKRFEEATVRYVEVKKTLDETAAAADKGELSPAVMKKQVKRMQTATEVDLELPPEPRGPSPSESPRGPLTVDAAP